MTSIYIVKSGIQSFEGVIWLNLKAFTNYDAAKAFATEIEKQIPPDDLHETEFVEIEDMWLS